MATYCCYQTAVRRHDRYRKSPDGWYYASAFRFSPTSATIIADSPTDADTLARAIVAFERADGGDLHAIDDLTLLRIIDNTQATLHIGNRDVLIIIR